MALEDFAQLFGGGDSLSGSDRDLSAFNRVLANNDYWSMAARPILGAQFNTAGWSPGTTLGVSLGQAFLGGLLENYGQYQRGQQLAKVAPVLDQLYRDPTSVAVPEGVDPEAFGQLKNSAIRENTSRARKVDDLVTSTKYGIFKDLFARSPKLAAQAFPEIADQLDAAIETSPLSVTNESVSVPQSTTGGPNLGVKTLEQISRDIYRTKINEGVPPTQAEVSARDTVDSLRKQAKAFLGDKIVEDSKMADDIEDLILKGKEGLAKAGVTGFPGSSTYEFAASYLPWAEEAKTQAEGDKLLELTKNLGAKANRIVGTGALSNMESKALFGTAMSPSNTPEQNQAILRGYEIGLERIKSRNDFFNFFIDSTGGNPQLAKTYWELYSKANPLVTQEPDGTMRLNTERTPWQTFDFQNAYKDYLSGKSVAPLNLEDFIRDGLSRGLSKEEIKAEWNKRGS